MRLRSILGLALPLAGLLLTAAPAWAQFGPAGPPAVGVVTVARRGITESSTYVGRVQAVDKVDIVARVTAFVAERDYTEGGEVEKGALLYRLERAPFEADLQAKQAAVQQAAALLRNATITLNRAQALLNTPAGQRSTVDDGEANRASQAAQLLAAQAQLKASQINLDYTEIRAPFAGKVARSNVSVGNVVSPTSGALTTVVSQDPMYVLFPVAERDAIALRNRYADKGGFAAVVVRITLPDGTLYPLPGRVDYADPSVAPGTDTITLRAVIPNPLRPGAKAGDPGSRNLADGAFVTVALEGASPVQVLTVPRSAVLSDQQGSFVYVVDADKKAQIRRVTLGQSTPELAVILSGVAAGDTVIADGLQRVRPGAVVNPAPLTPGPGAPAAPAATKG
jgi:membrane fusion protein (multidrug efflux system)